MYDVVFISTTRSPPTTPPLALQASAAFNAAPPPPPTPAHPPTHPPPPWQVQAGVSAYEPSDCEDGRHPDSLNPRTVAAAAAAQIEACSEVLVAAGARGCFVCAPAWRVRGRGGEGVTPVPALAFSVSLVFFAIILTPNSTSSCPCCNHAPPPAGFSSVSVMSKRGKLAPLRTVFYLQRSPAAPAAPAPPAAPAAPAPPAGAAQGGAGPRFCLESVMSLVEPPTAAALELEKLRCFDKVGWGGRWVWEGCVAEGEGEWGSGNNGRCGGERQGEGRREGCGGLNAQCSTQHLPGMSASCHKPLFLPHMHTRARTPRHTLHSPIPHPGPLLHLSQPPVAHLHGD
jgi:hypothetical protein